MEGLMVRKRMKMVGDIVTDEFGDIQIL